ncbi:MAG: SDR family oxidoreductase [Pseudomonadales bacterium]|jgi:NAD(P)-dependent dehydrogenase (short-subunit alcohol dehydrogenase family)|nr:SDR family oxidoreductase [Pseudomonadales bacterium]MDP6471621.1 SDR family oxidoreductase [Pseudomonadales bacterium]MDP6828884.1 SDR family oxidoreductase [Pseudomonadales bacterium]MDP6972804.1 SDR family oxidoreductase [Pseudomonadales bacterium]|tara:strand:- start:1225 stop:2013 length:789 start_codon:yes stop_codon:yes gene_type:complete
MELQDKVVVITGAGSGIGRALAIGLAAVGAKAVVCTDLNGDSAAETAAMIGSAASSAALDVADEAAIEALVAQTQVQHGGIDIFVSNAGYALPGGLELATEDWQRMMNVHTWSHLAAARAVIPGMIERGGGYLLSTASAAGLLTQMDSGPYAVSKHAAVALAEWIAINYADQNIKVSVLCPQAVRTNIGGPRKPGEQTKGQASFDGVLEADTVADACIETIREERFLVLPHPEVETYFQRKASDYDRWLRGMRRFKERISAG